MILLSPQKRLILLLLAGLLVTVFVISYFLWPHVKLPQNTDATLNFKHMKAEVKEKLTANEKLELIHMFNGKRLILSKAIYSCGFSEDISITIGDCVFHIARDTCNTIYFANAGKYFEVSQKDRLKITQIFEKHGGYFPCV